MAERLVGRGADVALSGVGREQAQLLAQCFSREAPPAAIHHSPRRRTRETAHAIAQATGARTVSDPAFDEIDFGAWTGRTFAELEHDPTWQFWNRARSQAQAADGERMVDAQARAMRALQLLAERHPDNRVVVVSHAEILRAILLHVLGLPLEDYVRFEISPASRSVIELAPWGAKVISMNERVAA